MNIAYTLVNIQIYQQFNHNEIDCHKRNFCQSNKLLKCRLYTCGRFRNPVVLFDFNVHHANVKYQAVIVGCPVNPSSPVVFFLGFYLLQIPHTCVYLCCQVNVLKRTCPPTYAPLGNSECHLTFFWLIERDRRRQEGHRIGI